MPESVKAELIDGVVYMASPARHKRHGEPHSHLVWFLAAYRVATPGTSTGDNTSLRLDLANEPQPDVLLRIIEEAEGQSKLDEDDYIEGAPELIGEIAASSVSYDLGPKMETYRRHGVLEYVVWRVEDTTIDWFILRDGSYDRLLPDQTGVTKSETFPGLWLDAQAMLNGELATVQQTLQQGLASIEHQQFVARLALKLNQKP